METQKRKDDAKLCITQLAEKIRNKKAATEVKVAREATEATTAHEDEGQAMSSGYELEEPETTEGSVDLGASSTQLKWPPIVERSGPRKNVKASKLAIDLITLTKGDLYDISETVHDVTNEVLQEFMTEHQNVLGALRAQLQELQVQAPQEGTLSTHVIVGTSTT